MLHPAIRRRLERRRRRTTRDTRPFDIDTGVADLAKLARRREERISMTIVTGRMLIEARPRLLPGAHGLRIVTIATAKTSPAIIANRGRCARMSPMGKTIGGDFGDTAWPTRRRLWRAPSARAKHNNPGEQPPQRFHLA